MKKVLYIVLIICLLIPFAIPIKRIDAKTLNDIYIELNRLKEQKQDNINKRNQTTTQINRTRNEIINTSLAIEKAYEEMMKAQEEIDQLNIEIEEKNNEIKETIRFLQISKGESEYLEYAFGAKSMTDFIYRISVVEQLTSHNNDLLKEMHNMIVENENKKKALREKEKRLANQRRGLSSKLSDLNEVLGDLSHTSVDIDAEIKAISDLIKSYEVLGCRRHDQISVCARVPLDTRFVRPVISGRVSSNFGFREFYLSGNLIRGFHYGIDMVSSQGEGSPIYSAANGRVAATLLRQRCGGNMVIIHHMINGVPYTTTYAHLLAINAKVGDIVNRNTIIATMGGGSTSRARGGYDQCTTGTHLHFQISTGHYLGPPPHGYSGWNNYTSRSINPRNLIQFPALGTNWSSR